MTMGMLLNMFDLIGTYERRVIANDKVNGYTIDTARITDTGYYAETAVMHSGLNGGKWVVVEQFLDHEQAETGHKRWVAMLETGKMERIRDIQTGKYHTLRG